MDKNIVDSIVIDKLEEALFNAGWAKETIECFLKSDPIIPSPISLTTFEVDPSIDKVCSVEHPRMTDSSSLIFKATK